MILLMVAILSMASACNGERSDFFVSSLSDMVRKGAAVISTFLNVNHPRFPAFHKLKQLQSVGQVNKGRVKEYNNKGQRNEFILSILRVLGVDSRKINDFAFDGFISLLHLIGEIFLKNGKTSRKTRTFPRDFSSFRFILGQPQVLDLLKDMRNPNLVDLILKESEEKMKDYSEENVDCVYLLICKTKPFVWGMQRSLRFFMNRENITGEEDSPREKEGIPREKEGSPREKEDSPREKEDEATLLWEKAAFEARMYFFVPSLREVIEEGDNCDRLFPNCEY